MNILHVNFATNYNNILLNRLQDQVLTKNVEFFVSLMIVYIILFICTFEMNKLE